MCAIVSEKNSSVHNSRFVSKSVSLPQQKQLYKDGLNILDPSVSASFLLAGFAFFSFLFSILVLER